MNQKNGSNTVAFDVDNKTCSVIVDSPREVKDVISGALEILEIYGKLRVIDLDEMVEGYDSASWKHMGYGWDRNDIDVDGKSIYIESLKFCYIIHFPCAHPIDEINKGTATAKEPDTIDTISFKDSKIAENDIINRPAHYQSETGLEVIDVIEAFTFDLKGIEATDTGNIIKYACRWSKKNGIQDLEKLAWYAQHLIEHLKKKEQYENE